MSQNNTIFMYKLFIHLTNLSLHEQGLGFYFIKDWKVLSLSSFHRSPKVVRLVDRLVLLIFKKCSFNEKLSLLTSHGFLTECDSHGWKESSTGISVR